MEQTKTFRHHYALVHGLLRIDEVDHIHVVNNLADRIIRNSKPAQSVNDISLVFFDSIVSVGLSFGRSTAINKLALAESRFDGLRREIEPTLFEPLHNICTCRCLENEASRGIVLSELASEVRNPA